MTLRRGAPLAILALLAACGGGDRRQDDRAEADSATSTAGTPPPPPAPAVDTGATAARDTGFSVEVLQPRPRELTVNGRTSVTPVVQVSVEDGHRVLYGPAEVPVSGGAFRLDLVHEATEAPRVFVYVSDPAGLHQAVVALAPTDQRATPGPVEAGPARP